MADSKMAETLKHFAAKVTTSSVNERLEILGSLHPCLEKDVLFPHALPLIVRCKDFPENAVKGVLNYLLYTLGRYQDNKSRKAVEDVIALLARKHGKATSNILPNLLADLAQKSKSYNHSPSGSALAMSALGWTSVFIRTSYTSADDMKNNDKLKKLVQVQSDLMYVALGTQRTTIRDGSYNRLKRVWNEVKGSAEVYGDIAGQLVANGPDVFCLVSCILRFFSASNQQEILVKYKDIFLEHYVKNVIVSRTKLAPHLLTSCNELLGRVTREDFSKTILPAVDKAMLRNPEICFQSVCYMLAGLKIELSLFVESIGKHLATECHSKVEETQQLAAEGCKSLALQCSDPEAMKKLVTHFFKVLNGSEGKLLLPQRLGMLTGIGALSVNTVSGSGSVQNLAASAAELFVTLLQQEVHEGTLVHALSMLSLWCAKFSTAVPDKLALWFKTGLSQKSSTSAVRNAYIQCMSIAFSGDRLIQGLSMLPLLSQTLEKASSQSSQTQLVTEALSAACILARLSLVDIQAEEKLGVFWQVVLDSDKQLLVSDRFLAQASDQALMDVASLVEKLVVDHPHKLSGKVAEMYYKALVYVLTHGPYSVRKFAKQRVSKMISTLGGTTVAMALVKKLSTLLQSQKLVDAESLPEGAESEAKKYVSPRILSETMTTLTALKMPEPEEATHIAIETLVDAHHPCIMHYGPDCWVNVVATLRLDAYELITSNVQDIMSHFRNSSKISRSQSNALSTLVRIAPQVVLPMVEEWVTDILSDPQITQTTREEVGIMLWTEGQLYDKSVLESAARTVESQANVKKENKLYSYAEQMAELELKKEMDKKKGKSTSGEPKLSKKQQEAMKAQLEKESAIRSRLLELQDTIEGAGALVEAVVEGSPSSTRLILPSLLTAILPLLRSPLAAPILSKVYLKLGSAAFEYKEHVTVQLVSFAALRILDPECQLDPGWSQEDLASMVTRAINFIHLETCPPKGLKRLQKRSPTYPAPTFAYIFPLIEGVLKCKNKAVSTNEKLLVKCLAIMSAHAQMRDGDDSSKELGPELLPREAMLRLCCTTIECSDVRIQQLAAGALVDTATCGSGEVGCAEAGVGEINILLDSLQSGVVAVREAVLNALLELELVLPCPDDDEENGLRLVKRIWIARFDESEDVKKLAENLWGVADMQCMPELCGLLVEDTVHHQSVVRHAASQALAAALKTHRTQMDTALQLLLVSYNDKLYLPPPEVDQFGRVISAGPPDDWPARCGIAMAIAQLAPYFPRKEIQSLFTFFVDRGLNDRSQEVRKEMLKAAVATVNEHGKENVSNLLPVFETFLAQAPDTASYDAVRQSIVILMGTLAKHLDKDDPKVKPIVAKLIETLSTPSQQVQEAIANCLPPLVPAIKADAANLVRRLLQLLLESDNYGERKGAAYGLAGLVKGLGILALKQLDIMSNLTDAIQNKKNPRFREGALFAFEMLCLMLGRLFEPYVVHLVPHLLLCFGDPNQYVREAADETSKAVMSKLSAHGVKLVLPSLLSALEEDSWRTKTGSVELLGAMAFCAPKQLSACLPSIVPKLSEVLTDSHLKVQVAGAQALKQIGSVIRNPEIQVIVPTLLAALQDPTKKTTTALQCLLETKFVHFIDAPSLALIMPVVQRAFQDRSTETRKMAAQIIGNMYSLTDPKDLSPYLPSVIPGLKQSLLDPVPEVRSVSARALGTMVKGMGEAGFEELLPWLLQTLAHETSSVDRSGAAQGLSEVVGGLGMEKLNKLMPDIIQTAERTDIAPHVRDGYIMMYIFLPGVFGDEFLTYVGPILPSILKALADESEFVRDTALKAGQRIINLYADCAIELLLPELERGLFDDNWRIRYSSVQLLGDLLYRISGVTGKMSTESAGDDDNFGTELSQKAIMAALGDERRNRVLAGLYMGRSDTALLVRQAALHVWKVIVAHTPKTLREILSTLFQLLLGCLASQSYDKRQVAARTLGDIVRKLGEKVLPEIIPILEQGLESEQSDQRQGVCIGLSEIMSSTSREHVVVFADSLIPTVRKALCDPLGEVRQAAAKTFDNLHANIGPRALDDILPDLLEKLDSDISEYALDGLKQVMAVKSRIVLPYLVPQLTSPPVNSRALSFLSAVAGEALTKHLGKILPALMGSLADKIGTPEEAQELEYSQSVVLSIQDDFGVRTAMDELLSACNHEQMAQRCAAVTILKVFCDHTKEDYSDYAPMLFRSLFHLMTLDEPNVLNASWECLNAVTKKLDASEMLGHISNVRQALRFAVSDYKGQELPGFCLPKKGITPLLPIFREGILNGPQDLKASAAIGLGEVIERTTPEALKPSVVNITGPLIRILGDRFSFNVKVAVLETLGLLLGKCGVMLKPFLPQLQTTFAKALNDPNRTVRLKAAAALASLTVIHTRVDPLFVELHSIIKTAEDSSIRDTTLQALRGCITSAGSKLSEKLRLDIAQTLEGLLGCNEDTSRVTASACLGALCQFMSPDELTATLSLQLLDASDSDDWMVKQGRCVALMVALKQCPDKLTTAQFLPRLHAAIMTFSASDRIPIRMSGLRCLGYVLRYEMTNGNTTLPTPLLEPLMKAMKQESNDVKQIAAEIITFLSKSSPLGDATIVQLVPSLVNGTKEKNTVVRSNSEFALVAMLNLRNGDKLYKATLERVESGMKESLAEVYSKSLKKILLTPDSSDVDIDDTRLV